MTTINKSDPKLTAFVLGELSEAEMLEIQKMLDENIELQNEVEAIRSTVSQVETLMQNENSMTLAPSVSAGANSHTPRPRAHAWGWSSALCVLVVCGVAVALLLPAKQAARQAAKDMVIHSEGMRLVTEAPTQTELEHPAAIADNTPIEDAPLRYAEKPRDSRAASAASAELADDAKETEKSDSVAKRPKTGSGALTLDRLKYSGGTTIPSADQPASSEIIGMGGMGGGMMSGKATGSGGAIYQPTPSTSASEPMPQPTPSTLLAEHVKGSDYERLHDARFGRPDQVAQLGTPIYPQRQSGVVSEKKDRQHEQETNFSLPARERAYYDPYNSANDEAYKTFVENEFLKPQDAPFSTFSIDVDTAAYTTMRRYIQQGQKPPADSVRLEEYVNYFKYDYATPDSKDKKPFATHVDVAACPWEPQHLLARIGIKGKEYSVDERPPLNLVFLIDTSGSMSSSNRLPLVQRGLTELVEMLQPKDRVAIVTYAGSSRVALPSISGQEKQAILDSINSLSAGGGTAGAEGIKTAYETARKYYDKKAQNRVILCTDGDFNVGMTNNSQLEDMIGKEAKSGVFLTILGFGMGNYKDERLKTLSMRGNGNYGYIDSLDEARRLLVEGLTGTLFAIAKDVKIQVDFNPANVAAYRLLGYENRKLRDEDFHNDKIDAGEIGVGHTVTALYEIVPVGVNVPSKVDESRYSKQKPEGSDSALTEKEPEQSSELMFVKLRYKEPDGDKSSLLEYPVTFKDDAELSGDAQFAAAAALFGMLLRESRHSGDGNFDMVLELAKPNVNNDQYRKEFVELVEKAKELR